MFPGVMGVCMLSRQLPGAVPNNLQKRFSRRRVPRWVASARLCRCSSESSVRCWNGWASGTKFARGNQNDENLHCPYENSFAARLSRIGRNWWSFAEIGALDNWRGDDQIGSKTPLAHPNLISIFGLTYYPNAADTRVKCRPEKSHPCDWSRALVHRANSIKYPIAFADDNVLYHS